MKRKVYRALQRPVGAFLLEMEHDTIIFKRATQDLSGFPAGTLKESKEVISCSYKSSGNDVPEGDMIKMENYNGWREDDSSKKLKNAVRA